MLGGGTLNVTGKLSGTTSQTLASPTINPGASTVIANSNGGTATNTALGPFSRNAGGTVNFTLPASGTISTSTTATNGLLGGWATVGGTDWATVSAGNIAAATYTTGTWSSGTNTNVTSTVTITSGSTTNSLRFAAAGAQTLTLSGSNTLESGGILVTASVGGNTTSITGGTLQGASGQDLVVTNHNSSGSLVIASTVADNGIATGLTKSGAGILTLSGANTYSGPTNLNGGTLDLGFTNPTARTGTVSLLSGSIAGSGTLTKNGGTFDFQSGSVTAALAGTAGLTKTTSGILTLTAADTYSGSTDLSAGTLLVNGSLNSAITVASGATLGGSGSLVGGVNFLSGSHLAPGNSPGPLAFINGLTLQTGAILDFQLGTASDRVLVTGGVLTGPGGTIGVTLNLSNAGGFGPGTYPLFDFADASTSSFDLPILPLVPCPAAPWVTTCFRLSVAPSR